MVEISSKYREPFVGLSSRLKERRGYRRRGSRCCCGDAANLETDRLPDKHLFRQCTIHIA
jgi:hypothetical protein